MKIIHTSDWHLGQKFLSFDRDKEHQMALDWLRETIVAQKADALIVAGDIFDIGNPPNAARKMYYRFLAGLLGTCCRHVVIIAGNHDSPSMLEAPREILQALNVHVVGTARDEIIELKDEEGEPMAVVAAVPFLREGFLHNSIAGESAENRLFRLREAIKSHYIELASQISGEGLPVLATGHLFAFGAVSSEKQDNIYLGDTQNIHAGDFPEIFSYVALGHIHRAQAVGGYDHIRYSGSLIPLSFSETKDEKGCCLLQYQGPKLKKVQFLASPTFRRLKTIEGDLETVKRRLAEFDERHSDALESWVEVIVHLDSPDPLLDQELREFTRDFNMEILRIRIQLPESDSSLASSGQVALEDLTPEQVFLLRCKSAGYSDEDSEPLVKTFRELLDWMNSDQYRQPETPNA